VAVQIKTPDLFSPLPSITVLPHIRFSVQVQNRQNFDVLWLCEEVHAVRKVAEERTVNVAFHTRELSRIAPNTLEY
jgi:hypothetical protein